MRPIGAPLTPGSVHGEQPGARRVPAPRRLMGRAASLAALVACLPLAAQRADVRAEATAGSEAERYLRVLQVAGQAPLYPWSLRGFSPRESGWLGGEGGVHPWSPRLAADSAPPVSIALLRPRGGAGFNSAFAHGGNDGAVWAGRGVTAFASAGATLRAGPLTMRLEPLAFWAENRAFPLKENGRDGRLAYGDGDSPGSIDLPQRFGSRPYAGVDPGQSTVRLDVLGVFAAASTANQQWGPGEDIPLLLGPNAAGFPHLALGTSSPWNVGVGRVHVRTMWGRLEQSSFSPVADPGLRFVTGVAGVFTPRGLPGLEVGAARFFHTGWRRGGPSLADLAEPFQAIFKVGLPRTGVGPDSVSSFDNQLASAFVRWVLPRGGVEVWGEYAREDHAWDFMDLVLEPDHSASYALGGRKVWTPGRRLVSLRAELASSQASHLETVRGQPRLYTHSRQRQGHTHRGQLLGSPAAFGGGGSVVALDTYSPGGRWRVEWARARIRGRAATADQPGVVDAVHSLGGEAVMFRSGVDLSFRLRADYETHRHFGADAVNLSAGMGVALGF